jgi:hypothetical protein
VRRTYRRGGGLSKRGGRSGGGPWGP